MMKENKFLMIYNGFPSNLTADWAIGRADIV